MTFFAKKKKIEQWHLEVTPGVHVECPKERLTQKEIWNCLPKGIFVFLVVFGFWGSFLSAFEVKYHTSFVGIAFFLTAMYFSGLFAFKKSWHKDLGYILYFFIYVMGIYTYRSYVNSGFAVILNAVRQQGEVYFGINAGDEFSEAIENREMAATVMVLFVGMFEILLLNIFISNYMSLKFVAFVTVPFFVFPMYFQVEPKMEYVLCLLGGFMGIYIFKNNGHFLSSPSRDAYERHKKEKVPTISYTQNTKVYRGVMVCMMACLLVVGAGSILFDAQDFRRFYKENEYKEASREGISTFLTVGFRMFYLSGYTNSGMSGGNLNGISAVRPSDETHLLVRFAPYSKETVYLKAFVGGEYFDGKWLEQLRIYGNVGEEAKEEKKTTDTVARQLRSLYEEGAAYSAEARMDVTNLGADESYEYVPYGAIQDSAYNELRSTLDYEPEESYTFYPNIRYHAQVKASTSHVDWWVEDEYRPALQKFIREAGVSATDPKVVEKVVAHFAKEYSYSYTPGRVPGGEDPINYFLDKNKKGVCIHFATAATLVFRELGIPARYVEGYAVDYNTVLHGKAREDLTYEDYYDGYSELGETKVMEVDVPGANAHAWVEIFQQGKGWVIVDPTPSVFEEAASGSFLDSLAEMWAEPADADLSDVIPEFRFSFLTSNGMKMLVVAILILGILTWIAWNIRKWILRYRSWHTKDLRKNLLWYYRDMCRKICKKDEEFARCSVPSEQLYYLAKRYEATKGETMDVETILHLFEQICFSPQEPNVKDYERVLKAFTNLSHLCH